MSSILVRALNMVEASILVSLFIYAFLIPGVHVVLFSSRCELVIVDALGRLQHQPWIVMTDSPALPAPVRLTGPLGRHLHA